MVKYKQTYINHFGYFVGEWIACEICGKTSIDIHHIDGRVKAKDEIENLIAVCRECHNKCHDHPEFNEKAREIHLINLGIYI